MTEDDGRGELTMQTGEKVAQALALSRGARVAGLAEDAQSSFVADADGMAVVAAAVCPLLP